MKVYPFAEAARAASNDIVRDKFINGCRWQEIRCPYRYLESLEQRYGERR